MNTEDKFYFGKPGEPESRKINDDLRRASVHISARNREGIEILETLWDAKNRGELSAGQESYLDELTKEARDIGWRPVGSKFSRPGHPERFAASGWQTIEAYVQVLAEEFGTPRGKEAAQVMLRAAESLGGSAPAALRTAIRTAATSKNVTDRGRAIGQIEDMIESASFSHPGQPERFANLEGNYQKIEARYSFPDGTTDTELMSGSAQSAVRSAIKKITARGNGAKAWVIAFAPANPRTNFPAHQKDLWKGEVIDGRAYERGGSFSRPGQPDKFDASSLDRGNFAEASKSPMLGKLLAAKVMPDGGWRAVQVGSDTLVISFEDADLARDFGRRASTKGYSATSPVATTGRYWNVEVKNGK